MHLSVAMCTYNGEKYIREQLMSIRNQTLQIDEIVICDDCSEDDTVTIIENLIRQYDLPVRLHVNTWNHGYRKNFEQAICRCSGDIIFLSDQTTFGCQRKSKPLSVTLTAIRIRSSSLPMPYLSTPQEYRVIIKRFSTCWDWIKKPLICSKEDMNSKG